MLSITFCKLSAELPNIAIPLHIITVTVLTYACLHQTYTLWFDEINVEIVIAI